MELEIKQTVLVLLAMSAALYGYVHYGREIPKKTLRPRPFTWLIWGVLSTCVAIIQIRNGADLGTIGALLGAASGYVLAGMSWFYGHRHVHGADIVSLVLAIGLLFIWGIVGDAVTAVAATVVFLIGFIPTIIRAWKAPQNERLAPFAMAIIKYSISFVLLGTVSVETAVYPVVLALANLLFLLMLVMRRKNIPKKKRKRRKKA